MTKHEKIISVMGLLGGIVFLISAITAQFHLLNSEIEALESTQVMAEPTQVNGILITPQMARIMNCIALAESGGNQKAIGQDGEIGIFQYKQTTWAFFNKKYKVNLNITQPIDQVMMTNIALQDNMYHHWTTWNNYCK